MKISSEIFKNTSPCYFEFAIERVTELCGVDIYIWGPRGAQWLRCCVPNRKVDGSIPDGVIGIFH